MTQSARKKQAAKSNNLTYITGKGQTGYRFIEKDPVVDEVREAIRKSGMSLKWISDTSGVSPGTLSKWDKGSTKRPQNLTVTFVMNALGYKRAWEKV